MLPSISIASSLVKVTLYPYLPIYVSGRYSKNLPAPITLSGSAARKAFAALRAFEDTGYDRWAGSEFSEPTNLTLFSYSVALHDNFGISHIEHP